MVCRYIAFKASHKSVDTMNTYAIDPKEIYDVLPRSTSEEEQSIASTEKLSSLCQSFLPPTTLPSEGAGFPRIPARFMSSPSEMAIAAGEKGESKSASQTRGEDDDDDIAAMRNRDLNRPRARPTIQTRSEQVEQKLQTHPVITDTAFAPRESDDLLLYSNLQASISAFSAKASASTLATPPAIAKTKAIATKPVPVLHVNSDDSQTEAEMWRQKMEHINAQESDQDDDYDGKAPIEEKWSRKGKKTVKTKRKKEVRDVARPKSKGKKKDSAFEEARCSVASTSNRDKSATGLELNQVGSESIDATIGVVSTGVTSNTTITRPKTSKKGKEKETKKPHSKEFVDEDDMAEDEPPPPPPPLESYQNSDVIIKSAVGHSRQTLKNAKDDEGSALEVLQEDRTALKSKARKIDGDPSAKPNIITVVDPSDSEAVDDLEDSTSNIMDTSELAGSTRSRISTTPHPPTSKPSNRPHQGSAAIAVVIHSKKKTSADAIEYSGRLRDAENPEIINGQSSNIGGFASQESISITQLKGEDRSKAPLDSKGGQPRPLAPFGVKRGNKAASKANKPKNKFAQLADSEEGNEEPTKIAATAAELGGEDMDEVARPIEPKSLEPIVPENTTMKATKFAIEPKQSPQSIAPDFPTTSRVSIKNSQIVSCCHAAEKACLQAGVAQAVAISGAKSSASAGALAPPLEIALKRKCDYSTGSFCNYLL